jgi:small-conductance mechanosensitive channel
VFENFGQKLISPAWIVGTIVAAIIVGWVVHALLWSIVRRMARRTRSILDDSLDRHCRPPSRYLFMVIAIQIMLPLAGHHLTHNASHIIQSFLTVSLVLSLAWLLITLTSVLEDLAEEKFRVDVKDNLHARRIWTQVRILKHFTITVIIILAVAVTLMSFERLRQFGTSILASAGVAGIIIGLAAQKTLGNLLAGIQIAITQPIRLDDVVVVENEWGRIEEITLTYVVVRIWDLRRLVLPISYFIEKPFQNWTRVSADLLGTVFIYTDYSVPLDDLRQALNDILGKSQSWDRKVGLIQVTNVSERTVEIRALMSAADSGALWNLRCEVREKLVAHIQEKYPESLPRLRTELHHLTGQRLPPEEPTIDPASNND